MKVLSFAVHKLWPRLKFLSTYDDGAIGQSKLFFIGNRAKLRLLRNGKRQKVKFLLKHRELNFFFHEIALCIVFVSCRC